MSTQPIFVSDTDMLLSTREVPNVDGCRWKAAQRWLAGSLVSFNHPGPQYGGGQIAVEGYWKRDFSQVRVFFRDKYITVIRWHRPKPEHTRALGPARPTYYTPVHLLPDVDDDEPDDDHGPTMEDLGEQACEETWEREGYY